MVNSKIHPTTLIDSSAKIWKNVVVGPFCVIEGGVVLEENCQLQSHIFIKSGTSIGKNTKIYNFPNLTIKGEQFDLKLNAPYN